jgi:hypothetical protein
MSNKFIVCLVASAMLISSMGGVWGQNIAQAKQRSINLLDAKCVSSGLGTVREEKLDVAIGRAVYSSQFYLGPGYRSAAMTCKIKPDSSLSPIFQTFNLGFGMRDNDTRSAPVEVRVFLDGKQAESVRISPSQPATLSFNVSNVSNVAIEAACTSQSQYCDRVYFYDASLQRPPMEKK